VYCFGPTFRAEKSKTRRHLTEFWMVEPEVAYANLDDIIELGEGLIVEVISRDTTPRHVVSVALDHITRAITRGKRASLEILRFANPQEASVSAIDARAWMPSLLGQLIATLPPSIALSSSIDPSVRFILGDREHLEQIITNLVFNARDALADVGSIHVSVTPHDDDRARISIRDDGPGIPPHMIDRIFEPLYTTKRNGTGLGLSIARRLMEGQNGTLTAMNHPDGGAEFELTLPTADAPKTATEPASYATPSVKRILLVEDDASVGAGLEALLQLEGYETTWVRAGAEACEAARLMKPQVAIIDVNLPDISGVDLVPMLRVQNHDLPVVLSTGHVELNVSNQNERILSLMKPYELHHLLSAIGEVTNEAA